MLATLPWVWAGVARAPAPLGQVSLPQSLPAALCQVLASSGPIGFPVGATP